MNDYLHLEQSDRKTRWNMKSEICIISCGAKKIWNTNPDTPKTRAKDAYIGPLFKKCKEYADTLYPESWYILSDKYGLIHPDTLISDYNTPPSAIDGNRDFIMFVSAQVSKLKLNPAIIVTTTGQIHQSIIKAVFTKSKIINPLSGLGQGKRMQKINQILGEKK